MHVRAFLRAGHWPTLACSFLYFDISFMVWVLLGALANSIVPEFDLGEPGADICQQHRMAIEDQRQPPVLRHQFGHPAKGELLRTQKRWLRQ